jgi:hypothetical protein
LFESEDLMAGLPDGLFSKSQFWVNFWMVLNWKVLVFIALWSVLRQFGIFYGRLVYFGFVWYILGSFGIFLPRFGILCKERSGSTDLMASARILFQL